MPWGSRRMRADCAMIEIDMAAPPAPIALPEGCGSAHVLMRWRGRPVGRFWLDRDRFGPRLEVDRLAAEASRAAAGAIAARALADALDRRASETPPLPASLTVAVCTRGRPRELARCLAALVAIRGAAPAGARPELLVVDNAPPDEASREVAEAAGVRRVVEPVPGLDFARNRALAETKTDWIAYIDDDAVPDRGWLGAFAEAARRSPQAGGILGPILPLDLATEAQRRFERSGGFGKGFRWRRYASERWGDPRHPANAGGMGTGANMILSTAAMRAIGGFDEALDTGPPLPGGGDLDAFYRLVRSGRTIAYTPDLLVFHEHRRDIPGLRRQYHSWGLSVMTLVRKHEAADPEMAWRHRLVARWWAMKHLRRLAFAGLGRGAYLPSFILADMAGALRGWFGEYARSRRRIAARKRDFA